MVEYKYIQVIYIHIYISLKTKSYIFIYGVDDKQLFIVLCIILGLALLTLS